MFKKKLTKTNTLFGKKFVLTENKKKSQKTLFQILYSLVIPVNKSFYQLDKDAFSLLYSLKKHESTIIFSLISSDIFKK